MLIDYAFVKFKSAEELDDYVALLLFAKCKQVGVDTSKLSTYKKLRYFDPMDQSPEDSDFAVWGRHKGSFGVEILNHNKRMRSILDITQSIYKKDCVIEEGFNLTESAPPLMQVDLLTWIGEHPRICQPGFKDELVVAIHSNEKSEPEYHLSYKLLTGQSMSGDDLKSNKSLSPANNIFVVRKKPKTLSLKMNSSNLGEIKSFYIA